MDSYSVIISPISRLIEKPSLTTSVMSITAMCISCSWYLRTTKSATPMRMIAPRMEPISTHVVLKPLATLTVPSCSLQRVLAPSTSSHACSRKTWKVYVPGSRRRLDGISHRNRFDPGASRSRGNVSLFQMA